MMNDALIRKKILKAIAASDYMKGRNYNSTFIKKNEKITYSNQTQYRFTVRSESFANTPYHVWINFNEEGEIFKVSCDCLQFDKTRSCKHVGACLWHYREELFGQRPMGYQEQLTKNIFDYLLKETETKSKASFNKKVNFELYLVADNFYPYYDNEIEIYFKIGMERLYICRGTKARNMLETIYEGGKLCISKSFTLDMEEHFLTQEEEEITQFLYEVCRSRNFNYSGNALTISGGLTKQFLRILKGKSFYLNDYFISEYKNEFPLDVTFEKKEGKYSVKLDTLDKLQIVTSDFEYVQIENVLYHVQKKARPFLQIVFSQKLNELQFREDSLEEFKNCILPLVKDKITVDSSITEVVISGTPNVKLYFDVYQDCIICHPKFIYAEEEIDYFDTTNTKIVRDETYEKEVVQKVCGYDFVIENNRMILNELDSIVYFLEEGLKQLGDIYEIYTTEKLKNVDIIKKTSVSSSFSIGKDNIMSYSFDLGNIDSKEIEKIFSAMERKKRYYRLKSGDILTLEKNENLFEFKELVEDLELKGDTLEEGQISKYKAIYLDSLKLNENFHIKTNNLFKQLVDNFYAYKDSQISLTTKEKNLLRPYQIEGVRWLYTLTKTGFGGILADEMGLGKSIQTIYYMREMLKENSQYKFLIVVPTSLVYNWENEFQKFAPDMKYKMLVGLKSKRWNEKIDDVNILITTYGLLREDKEFYQEISFKTMIIDEAQNIKNINTEITKTVKGIKAETKFALTGTPIENSVSELWSIFDFIMPGYLGTIKSFESKFKISDLEQDSQKIKILNKQIQPFILRRYKKDVIKDLPDKIENNIYVELTDLQKQIYLKELEYVNEEMDSILQNGGISKARFLILKLLTKLRQICIDPQIVYKNYIGGSGKMEEFVHVVKTSVENGHKILVFTSFKEALSLAQNRLSKEGITSYRIDGSVSSKKRMELVQSFNEDKTNVFFIMLKAGGTGLNLTGADVVVHLDLWWNPQAENQATDRAHRIGQKNVVEVIKFISKGTIEEKILELQNKKKLLSDKLIDSEIESKAFSKLTEKDIKELLSIGMK